MKNIFIATLILTAGFFTSYGQDQNNDNSSDDVYYQDNSNNTAPDGQYQSADQGADQNDDQNQPEAGAPDYQTFYDQLSPYGQWVNSPSYGYVWVPTQVPGDFSPYLTNGNWVYTDYGTTWVSDYPWGWATFHYGRWYYDPTYGWVWVPGYDWAPAWVVWGDYGGDYCWAPIWPGVVISAGYRPDYHYWHFVPHDHILHKDLGHYTVDSRTFAGNNHFDVAQINNHVGVINHASSYKQGVFFAGPKVGEVEKYTGQKVSKVAVSNVAKPGASKVNGKQVEMYRPAINRTANQPAPVKVSRPEEVHPVTNHQQPAPEHINAAPKPAAPQQPRQSSWSPPRQSTPRPSQPQNNFIPTERPAAAPQRQYSAPSRPSFGGGGGGGGSRGGGGGRH